MYVGTSACEITNQAIRYGWLYHKPTKTDVFGDTDVDTLFPGIKPSMKPEDINAYTCAVFSECVVRAPKNIEFVWHHRADCNSSASFHMFLHTSRSGDNTWLLIKCLRHESASTLFMNRMYSQPDAQLHKHIVPTGFLLKGRIQVMQYMTGDLWRTPLVDTAHTFSKFMCWLLETVLLILQHGGVYSDMKPGNILVDPHRAPHYVLCDVDTFRVHTSQNKSPSSYPISEHMSLSSHENAIFNMLYGMLVTLYNIWAAQYNITKADTLRICVRLHHQHLRPGDGKGGFTLDHPYFTDVTNHPNKPILLRILEKKVLDMYQSTHMKPLATVRHGAIHVLETMLMVTKEHIMCMPPTPPPSPIPQCTPHRHDCMLTLHRTA